MSRSVDLFISSGAPLEDLAATIAARAGLSVEGPSEEERIVLAEGDLRPVLHPHRFVDEDDLALSRYPYALSLRTTATGHLGMSPETALLRRVAAELADHQVLLVLDLQYRLAVGERQP